MVNAQYFEWNTWNAHDFSLYWALRMFDLLKIFPVAFWRVIQFWFLNGVERQLLSSPTMKLPMKNLLAMLWLPVLIGTLALWQNACPRRRLSKGPRSWMPTRYSVDILWTKTNWTKKFSRIPWRKRRLVILSEPNSYSYVVFSLVPPMGSSLNVPMRSQNCAKSTRVKSIMKGTCSTVGMLKSNVFLNVGHVMDLWTVPINLMKLGVCFQVLLLVL